MAEEKPDAIAVKRDIIDWQNAQEFQVDYGFGAMRDALAISGPGCIFSRVLSGRPIRWASPCYILKIAI
jgi:hypothetical protein